MQAFQYRWIPDNQGAVQWADKEKFSFLPSQYACLFVTSSFFSDIYREDADCLPGIEIGKKDLMMIRMTDMNLRIPSKSVKIVRP